MTKAIGYAAQHSYSRLKPISFERDDPKANEVEIEVLFCGVCHSDIHQVKNEWSNTVYPCMPGHEIVGRVTRAGTGVSRHAVGDLVGVGCMIDSCRECEPCHAHEENYCEGPNSWLATYNGPMVPAKMSPDGSNMYGRDNTYGGYSSSVVVPEDFVLKIPASLKPEVAAPILCAGVTTYSPMTHWGVKAGDKVGIVGFGGLGDMAAKIAKAMGAEVTLFTTTAEKLDEAQRLGVTVVLQSDKKTMTSLANSFDFMLSTIPEKHDVNPFVQMLKRDCTLAVVGAIEPLASENNQERVMHRKSVAGSLIGSIAETQAVLDLCAEHGIGPDIQVIPIQEINKAYKHVEKGEVRFRYVIDMASLKQDEEAA
ncbi:NAD(P)-dependent alcohol dehydrogenase [Lichenicola sp.]|uniref:NAD(P)-dependent alcohol dehydrogenase n=1 Tax=Lichenicola sp. TaxID=2804529 RepID=UPI003B00EDD1